MKRDEDTIFTHSRLLSELMGQLRVYAGLSQKELAARGSISVHTVATCERFCGRLSIDKILQYISGVGFLHLTVFYETEEHMELAGTPFFPGKKHPRPSVIFKSLYDAGILDRKEVSRQLRIMKQLRKLAAH